MRLARAGLLAAAACLIAGAAVAAGRVSDLAMADGPRQRVLVERPTAARRAILVMLPGGAGDVGIDDQGAIAHDQNFVIRTADLWLAKGFAILIPDAVDGRNLRGLRSTPFYADVVARIVAFARAEAAGPVVLLGTSQGAIAAMNGAAHLGQPDLAGVILSESVSRRGGSHETVFDAGPGRVSVPALVVANRDDACPVAPPADADRIAAAMTGTTAEVLVVTGGAPAPDPCASLSPHGYFGIEGMVVDRIAAWIDTHIQGR